MSGYSVVVRSGMGGCRSGDGVGIRGFCVLSWICGVGWKVGTGSWDAAPAKLSWSASLSCLRPNWTLVPVDHEVGGR